MDLRVLFPADHRYGPMVFSMWRPEFIACGSDGCNLLTCVWDGNEVIVRWWIPIRGKGSTPSTYNLVVSPDSPSRMRSRIACTLSDLAQTASVDLNIESDPQDPLV
jgi:hypothetical protein